MPYGKGITVESAARCGRLSLERNADGLDVTARGEWPTDSGYRAFELDEAERLRDWFLENFPLPTPEPAPEPKAQSWVWVDGTGLKTTLSPVQVAVEIDLALDPGADTMIELPTEDGVQTFVSALRVTHIRAAQA